MYTRREFGKLTLAGLAMPTLRTSSDSLVNGVRVGVQTYSFRDLPRTSGGDAVDSVITAMTACGLVECELWSPQIEPEVSDSAADRNALRKWRVETPLAHFRTLKRKFDAAGLTVYAYNYSFNDAFTDQEIDRGFAAGRALGAEIITASATITVAKRVVPFAQKHKMIVAMHGHSNVTDPNEFATPASFAAALAMSKYFKVNLDIGHFVSAGFDPIVYLKAHHQDVTNLHLKDQKKNQGDNTPWGRGDTPIKEVLQLVKREGWPIRAFIEYEYQGAGTPVQETKKCFEYAKQALA
jgi:sugar phosphate isomerase/epimerase